MSGAVGEPDRVVRITELELLGTEERRRLARASFVSDWSRVSPAMKASIEAFARVAVARRRAAQRRDIRD